MKNTILTLLILSTLVSCNDDKYFYISGIYESFNVELFDKYLECNSLLILKRNHTFALTFNNRSGIVGTWKIETTEEIKMIKFTSKEGANETGFLASTEPISIIIGAPSISFFPDYRKISFRKIK